MAKQVFTGGALNVTNLLTGLTGTALTKALAKIAAFEAKVEAGKSASIKIGADTFQFKKASGVQAVTFTNNGTAFTTAAALTTAATAPTPTPSPTPAPTPFTLAAATADFPALTSGNDTITGAAGTYDNATDFIADFSTTDSDSLTIAATGALTTGLIRNIETVTLNVDNNVTFTAALTGAKAINVNITSTSARAVDATGVSGATLTVNTAATVPSGALTVAGDTSVDLTNVATNVVAGAGVTNFDVDLTDNDDTAVSVSAGSAKTVVVSSINDAGVTLTAGTFAATDVGIALEAVVATGTSASVSAAGTVNLDAGAATASVDLLTLSGNGAAVTYNLSTTTGAVSEFTIAGSQAVTLAADSADLTGTKLTKTSTGNVTVAAALTGALDLTNFALVTNVSLTTVGTQTVTVKNGQAVSIDDEGANTLTFAVAGTAGSADTLSLTINDDGVTDTSTAATTTLELTKIDADLFDTLNISASNDALVLTTGLDADDVTVTGSADVDFSALKANSLNASKSTGDIVASTISEAGSFDTGSGADDLTFNSTGIQTSSTGDGDDKITVTATGIGSLFVGGNGNDTIDVDDTTGGLVVDGGAGNDTIDYTAGAVDAKTDGGANTDTLVLDNNDYSTLSTFSFTNIEIVDITLGDTTISNAQFKAQSFQLKGDGLADDLTIIDTTDAGVTIDARSITVDLANLASIKLTGGDGNDTLIGTSGANTLTGGEGVDTLTGGAAADVFVFASADVDTTAGAVTDVIADFVAGTDTIGGSFGPAVGALVEAGAAAADLATLLAAADLAIDGTTIKYYVGQVGTDVYVVTDDDGSGYTDVIKLTGQTLATFNGEVSIV